MRDTLVNKRLVGRLTARLLNEAELRLVAGGDRPSSSSVDTYCMSDSIKWRYVDDSDAPVEFE